MKKVSNRSYAKVNLTLDLLGKAENGYHEIRTVMQSISLFDMITVYKKTSGIELSSNIPYLPLDSENIAYKAAQAFFDYTGIKSGINIDIAKRIPVGAGLAGGSSNASAVLKSMNELFETGLSLKELCSIGAKLGSDVPFCILGGTRLAEGFGEKISSLPKISKCGVLIAKPPFSVSTREAYEKSDTYRGELLRPDTELVIDGLHCKNLRMIAQGMGNSFESIIAAEHPVIETIKEEMLERGALAAQMSGSGPTVFGIFTNVTKARIAKQELWEKYKTVYLCTTV